jgi:hypothetical protein
MCRHLLTSSTVHSEHLLPVAQTKWTEGLSGGILKAAALESDANMLSLGFWLGN